MSVEKREERKFLGIEYFVFFIVVECMINNVLCWDGILYERLDYFSL